MTLGFDIRHSGRPRDAVVAVEARQPRVPVRNGFDTRQSGRLQAILGGFGSPGGQQPNRNQGGNLRGVLAGFASRPRVGRTGRKTPSGGHFGPFSSR